MLRWAILTILALGADASLPVGTRPCAEPLRRALQRAVLHYCPTAKSRKIAGDCARIRRRPITCDWMRRLELERGEVVIDLPGEPDDEEYVWEIEFVRKANRWRVTGVIRGFDP